MGPDQEEPLVLRVALAAPRWLLEQPAWSMALEVALVILHGVATVVLLPSPFNRLVDDENAARSLYLALGSAGAPLAGFAGLIVIFALGERQQFKVLREQGGRRLDLTWVNLFLFPFTALIVGLSAALVTTLGGAVWAPFVAEFALLLLMDTLLRGSWLIRSLIGIIRADDEQQRYGRNTVSTSELGMDSY